jgi:TRAP transporter TAXI family solute receptor
MRERSLCLLISLFVLPGLVGCRKGPPKDALVGQLQNQLDSQLEDGLFEVADFTRRGSYPFTIEDDDRSYVLIYYDAELRFLQDHQLADWDALNLGSLISVLGAKPRGVEGVVPDGNVSGDILEVRGTSAYVRDNETWLPTRLRPVEPSPPDGKPVAEAAPHDGQMAALDQVVAALEQSGAKAELADVEADLHRLVQQARQRLARKQGWITLAGGSPGGTYQALADSLMRSFQTRGRDSLAVETGGSIDNALLVERGEVQFAFVQNDVAHMARTGEGMFSGRGPMHRLRALCSLYPEAIQIVVRGDSSINELADLEGEAVDLGLPESGIRFNAVGVLRVAEMELTAFREVRGRGIAEALQGLISGDVAAVFLTSSYPNRALSSIANLHSVRVLELSAELVKRASLSDPYLVPVSIPARTYPGQAQPVRTLAVTALLVTRDDVPNDTVTTLLTQLFEGIDELGRESVEAWSINRRSARIGVSIPFHPAAEAVLGR